MRDIVSRVPALSFIDMNDILVFARFGRLRTDGAFATCHCLSLPPSEPGYYFWRDRDDRHDHPPVRVVRDEVARRDRQRAPDEIPDLVRAATVLRSVARPIAQGALLPARERRVDRKARHGDTRALSHRSAAERHQADRDARTAPTPRIVTGRSSSSRWPRWCRSISTPVPIRRRTISSSTTSPRLNKRHNRVVATSFRTFPSYPQRFIERLPAQPPCDASLASVDVEPWREGRRRECYSETDLHVREFTLETSRRFVDQARHPRSLVRLRFFEFQSGGSTSREASATLREPHRASLARGRSRLRPVAIPTCDAPGAVVVKKMQVTRLLLARRYRNTHHELLTSLPRQRPPGLREDVLREAAAVEPAQI